MYRGGQYKLYRFRRYTDVRLVFAPEAQVAFFGGDPDNFTYPRHDLDMSLLPRLRERPAGRTRTHYYRWSANGSPRGRPRLRGGQPGLDGPAQHDRPARVPAGHAVPRHARVAAFARSPCTRRSAPPTPSVRPPLRNPSSASPTREGGHRVLRRPPGQRLMDRKRAWEREFRGRVNANPELRRQYGAVWDNIARIRQQMRALWLHRALLRLQRLRRAAARRGGHDRPDARRDGQARHRRALPEFRDAKRQRLERNLYGGAPIDTAHEVRLLTAYLDRTWRGRLPGDRPGARARPSAVTHAGGRGARDGARRADPHRRPAPRPGAGRRVRHRRLRPTRSSGSPG